MKTTSKLIITACSLLAAGIFMYKYRNNKFYTNEEMKKNKLEDENKLLDNPVVSIEQKKRSILEVLKDMVLSNTNDFDPNQDITEFDGDQKIEVTFDEGNYVINILANYELKKERSDLKRTINGIKSKYELSHPGLVPYMKAFTFGPGKSGDSVIKKYEDYDHESDDEAYITLSLRSSKATTDDVYDLLYMLVYDESMTEYDNYPIYFDIKDDK